MYHYNRKINRTNVKTRMKAVGKVSAAKVKTIFSGIRKYLTDRFYMQHFNLYLYIKLMK